MSGTSKQVRIFDAGDLLRLADVDRLDEAVRDGRVLDPDEQRILRGQIIIVFCPAGRLVEGVDADLTSAYDVHSGTSILPGDRQTRALAPILPVFRCYCSYCSIQFFEEKVDSLSYFMNNGFFVNVENFAYFLRKTAKIPILICRKSQGVWLCLNLPLLPSAASSWRQEMRPASGKQADGELCRQEPVFARAGCDPRGHVCPRHRRFPVSGAFAGGGAGRFSCHPE